MVYSASIDGKRIEFGISGKLYENNVMLYDRQTNSLWLQLQDRAVTGRMSGTKLTKIPSTETTWAAWKSVHPDTLVLSTATGYARDYQHDPYAHYAKKRRVMFSLSSRDDRYHPKEKVLGIVIEGTAKAYPFSEFADEPGHIVDSIKNTPIVLEWDPESETLQATDLSGSLCRQGSQKQGSAGS